MKNFRKVLALVLVVATLFSFTAMTSAVNIGEYEDWSKVSYAEAVDVLSAVGILNGYEDDTFKPTNTISREEMAKMIATMANAGDDVSTLYASACTFADVPAAKWSASYVAYCAKTGIVAGRSASTFDPTGKVTGLETAKMLLVVLGFSAEEQGYVGADWKVNVLRDAKVMGLTNNFAADYDIDAAITREEAAQMMLNALEAPCVVGVISDGLVTVTNALIVNWKTPSGLADLLKVTAYGKLKDAMDAGNWCLYGNVLISNDTLWTRLYNGLTKTTADRDCYGRPATGWTWTDSKGVKTWLSSTTAAPVWSSYKTNTNEIANKVAAYKNATLAEQYVNGKTAGTQGAGAVDGGKGALVEMYVVDNKIILVEINAYVGTVGQMNTAKGTFVLTGTENGQTATYTVNNTYGLTVADEGKKVVYWPCNEKYWYADADLDNIHDLKLAAYETVTVHGSNDGTTDYFCDKSGAKNEYAANCISREVGYDELGTKINVIYDKYGYVLYWAPVGTETYVTVMVPKSSNRTLTAQNQYGDTYAYTAKFVDFAAYPAASDALAVDEAMYNFDKADHTLYNGTYYGLLVEYEVGANGKREFVKGSDGYAFGGTLTKGSCTITGTSETVAGTDNTQYLLRVYDYSKKAYTYKYFNGKSQIDASYLLNNIQYLMSDEAGFVSYVFADATYASVDEMAFVMSYDAKQNYINEAGQKQEYYLYKAYVGEEVAYVGYENKLGDSVVFPTAVNAKYVKLTAETHDGKPVYLVYDNDVVTTMGVNFMVSGNTMKYTYTNGAGTAVEAYKDVASDAVFYMVTTVNGKTTSKAVTKDALINYCEFHGWDNVYAWFDTNAAGAVDVLYVYSTVA